MIKRLPSASSVRTAILLTGVLLLATSCGWSLWDNPMTTVRPRSDFGRWIDEIFMKISWITLVIFIAVEGEIGRASGPEQGAGARWWTQRPR